MAVSCSRSAMRFFTHPGAASQGNVTCLTTLSGAVRYVFSMWTWILAVVVLVIPCYFAVLQIRDWVAAARRGELQCPVRPKKSREQVNFAD